jgi:Carboxypeptidase regulatory-like domain/TonB-dependent Receptor Plug Domain
MKNKQIICTALAMLFVVCIRAQGFGEIHGKVLDTLLVPAPGAVVVATNGVDVISYATDDHGKFRLKALKSGDYTVQIFMMGMDTITITNIHVVAEKTVILDDQILRESTVFSKTVVIEYTPPHLDPTGGTINTIGAADLKTNAAFQGGNVNKLVISMTPEIKASPDGEELYFRGSRAGTVIYFIDGVKYTGNNVNIPASGVQSVSVYTGGLPAQYGDTTGGVIVVETKNYLTEYYRSMNQ